MKIYIITVAPIPEQYNDAMSAEFQQRYQAVISSDTELQVRGLAAGPVPSPENLPDYRNHYYAMLLASEVVKSVLAAEAEGADAVVVNCFDDPGVKEARAVASIPVFGICEPSLHFACQLGRDFGALVPDLPGQVSYLHWQVRDHGLHGRLLTNGVRKENKPFVESQPESNDNPEVMAGRLKVDAEQLVREGADVVLVACGGLGAVCDRVGLHHITVDGRQVPMVTPLPVALKHTEMMLDLQRAHGIPIPAQAQDSFRLTEQDRQRIQQGFGVEETA
ncbi:MAG: aspartate/glutamate racemase family protein [Halioglobus sp.]